MKYIDIILLDNKSNIKYTTRLDYIKTRFDILCNVLSDYFKSYHILDDTVTFYAKESKTYNTIVYRGFIRVWEQEDIANKIPD